MKTAEIASEKTAAKARLLVSLNENIGGIPFYICSERPILSNTPDIAGGVPNSKNGRFLRFSEQAFRNSVLMKAKGW